MASSDDPTPPPSATDPHVKWPTPKFVAKVQNTLRLHTILLLIILFIVTAIGYKVFFGNVSVQTPNVSAKVKIVKQMNVSQAPSQAQTKSNGRI